MEADNVNKLLQKSASVMDFRSFIIHRCAFSTDESRLGISNVFVVCVGFLHAAHL